VAVQSRADGAGRILVTISARTSPGTRTNALRSLTFTRLANAVVEIPGQPAVTGPTTLELASGTQQITFQVRRVTAGRASTVELDVVDVCGRWPTFVGAGTGVR
jgi:hypothetical protein